MAMHSSVLAWGIPWTEEPGRPQSMELQQPRYNLVTKEKESVLLSRESHRQHQRHMNA